jgi:hypothetical protein
MPSCSTALVTTEKDSVNLCPDCDDLMAPLELYWLKVSMAIEDEEALLAELQRLV